MSNQLSPHRLVKVEAGYPTHPHAEACHGGVIECK
jgi:hypothetical protein